jgi:hypothetical protein
MNKSHVTSLLSPQPGGIPEAPIRESGPMVFVSEKLVQK